MSSYLGTYSYAVLSILTMLLMTGLFSRYWSSNEFLEFTKTLRYMGLIVALSSFSLGFAIIKKSKCYSLKQEIYPAALSCVTITSIALGALFVAASNNSILLIFWIISVSIFHIYISSVRFEDPFEANYISILLKVVLIIFVACLCIILEVSLISYFYIYGLASLGYILWGSIRRGYRIFPNYRSLKIVSELYAYSFSRAIDNAARITYHIIPVWISDLMLGGAVAGLIVLSLSVTKAFESSMQPVILHIHTSRVLKSKDLEVKKILIATILAVLFVLLAKVLLYYYGDILVTAWITKEYLQILEYIKITIWSVPCVVLLQLMKSEMESKVSVSPFVYLNVTSLFILLLLSIFFSSTVEYILLAYVATYILRTISSFALYVVHMKNEKAS